MKKFIFIIVTLGLITYLIGCGKKQQPISEAQEPISIEELATMTAPAITVTPSSESSPTETKAAGVAPGAQLEVLLPSGPYKPTTSEIQTALKNAGFYTGMIDGKRGPLTKKAIEDFQRTNGLDADGKVGPKTWAVLSKYLNPEPAPSATSRKKR